MPVPSFQAAARVVEDRAAPASAPACAEILVMNRDPELRTFLNRALFAGNFSSTSVTTAAEARAILARGGISLVLLGVEETVTPELDGFLAELRRAHPGLPVVAVAPRPGAELVRDVLLRGVSDFLLDPFAAQGLVRRLREILGTIGTAPSAGPVPVPAPAPVPVAGGGSAPQACGGPAAGSAPAAPPVPRERKGSGAEPVIIAKSPRMLRILEIADQIAQTDSTVLIQGESGTGKEIIAKRIHARSPRVEQPFVEVNCGAIPENLLESQLFGHEKGSFTGAFHRQAGLFEIADRGTIFLDEIGEMGLDMQVKLLRVLQNQEFRRIGGSQTLKVNVRVIAATNRDLKMEVEKRRFRVDLYYRLNVIALEIPPLRDRLEEVPDLVESFCSRLEREKGISRKAFTPDAILRMQKCRWMGNVRELENVVERLVLLGPGPVIGAADVDEHLKDTAPLDSPFTPTLTLDEVRRIHIASVLKTNGGNKMRTARLLGINVKTLYNLIKALNIPVE